MENYNSQLSEIKEIDYNSNDSQNSNNNVYKKENKNKEYKTNVNKLKEFNYDKVATNKMKYINFNNINNSILKLKEVLQINNPLSKYIQNAKPYNILDIKYKENINPDININEKLLLNKEKNIANKSIFKKLRKDVINFNNRNTKKNFYFSRMNNIESKKLNLNLTNKIILIQKHIRGFLTKKIINSSINNEISRNIITSILIIQRATRKFLFRKKYFDNYIIKIINKERNIKCNKIIQLFRSYYYRNSFLKNLLIKKIVITRHLSAELIQSTFKSHILRKKILPILKKEKKSFLLIYPFKAQSVQIKIFINGISSNNYKIYDYSICPIRKCFVTYINKKEIKPGKYICQMLVDKIIALDKRYKSVKKNNNLYNLIPIGNNKSKKLKQLKNGINEIPEDKDKKIKKEIDNFYFYYYNNEEEKEIDNDISFSNNSNKEIQNNNKNYLNKIDDNDPDQVIDISKSKFNYKYNNSYLKSNYNYIKEYKNKKKEKELIENRIKNIWDNLYLKKEEKDNDSINNSENLNYKYILEEISQSSVKSFNTNINVKNLDSYSKRTHKTKFKKNISKSKNPKKTKKKKYDIKF